MKSTIRKPIAIFFGYLSILNFGVTGNAEEQEQADAWELVRNFEGDWTGTADGQFGKSTVDRTDAFVPDAAYLHEKHISTYPPQDRNPDGEVHEHWSFFSHDDARQALVLRQFHDERIVNQFVKNTDLTTQDVIVFDSESIENYEQDWSVRESYPLISKDEFIEEFYLAAPRKDFELYVSTHLERIY